MKKTDRFVIKDIYTPKQKKRSDDFFFAQCKKGESLSLADIMAGKYDTPKVS